MNMSLTSSRRYLAPDTPTIGRKSSISRSLPRLGHFNRAGMLADDINTVSPSIYTMETSSNLKVD